MAVLALKILLVVLVALLVDLELVQHYQLLVERRTQLLLAQAGQVVLHLQTLEQQEAIQHLAP